MLWKSYTQYASKFGKLSSGHRTGKGQFSLWSQRSEVKWKSLGRVQLFATPWITVHGILQARILEWGAFPFSRGSSQPRDLTQVSHIAGGFSTSWATRKGLFHGSKIPEVPHCSCMSSYRYLLHSKSTVSLLRWLNGSTCQKPTVFRTSSNYTLACLSKACFLFFAVCIGWEFSKSSSSVSSLFNNSIFILFLLIWL